MYAYTLLLLKIKRKRNNSLSIFSGCRRAPATDTKRLNYFAFCRFFFLTLSSSIENSVIDMGTILLPYNCFQLFGHMSTMNSNLSEQGKEKLRH